MIDYFEKVTTKYHHVAPAIMISSTCDPEAMAADISATEVMAMVEGKMALRVVHQGNYVILQPYALKTE